MHVDGMFGVSERNHATIKIESQLLQQLERGPPVCRPDQKVDVLRRSNVSMQGYRQTAAKGVRNPRGVQRVNNRGEFGGQVHIRRVMLVDRSWFCREQYTAPHATSITTLPKWLPEAR